MNNTPCIIKTINLLFTSLLVLSCSSVQVDEELVADSSTNPQVSQRTVQKGDEEVEPGHVNFRPVRVDNTEIINLPSGSLFRADKAIGLYQPNSKYEIGDMILVKLDENMSAKKNLDYKTQKTDSFKLNPVTLNAGSINVTKQNINAEYDQEKDFDSSAESKQSNSLVGDITVFVRSFTYNGNLIVAGEKWMELNRGKEYIRFSGEIRTKDIDKNNTISSVKVGNSQVEFTGKGDFQENQNISFLGKLFGILD